MMDAQMYMFWILFFAASILFQNVKPQNVDVVFNKEDFEQFSIINHADPAILQNTLSRINIAEILKQEDTEQRLHSALESGNNDLSTTCVGDVTRLMLDARQGELYALKILDSFGKPPSGLFQLNNVWLGTFDQCQETSKMDGTQTLFTGKYFYVTLKGNATMNIKLKLGTCFPDSCSNFGVRIILTTALSGKAVPMFVYSNKEADWGPWDIVALVITCLLVAIIVLSTGYDAICCRTNFLKNDTKEKTNKNTQGTLQKLLLSFSILVNGSKILDTTKRPGSLNALNGMRVITLSWVVLGHGVSIYIKLSNNTKVPYLDFKNKLHFQGLANATVSVDSFFFMSGFLVAYLTMKQLYKTSGKMNWALFYFHRYWRLTPLYMFCIMITACFFPFLSSGPHQFSFAEDFHVIQPCKKYWWTNALYINNFYPDDNGMPCFGVSWYLANDMQFYVISPLILWAYFKNRKVGMTIWTALMLMCLIATGVVARENGLTPLYYDQDEVDPVVNWHVYTRPYYRIGPYLIGILLGFILTDPKVKDIKPTKGVLAIGWSSAVVIALWVLYGLYPYVKDLSSMNPDLAAFYTSAHRTAWAISMAWVIYACVKGYGGPVNWFLSWSIFIPMARLSYAVYLMHMTYMYLVMSNQTYVLSYSNTTTAFYFTFFMVFSYVVGLILSLVFEAPFVALESLILPKKQGKGNKNIENGSANAVDQNTNGSISVIKVSGNVGSVNQGFQKH